MKIFRDTTGDIPLYSRALRLRYIRPSAALCFVLFEGITVLAALLAFAELTSWWSVVALPLTVAVMVKINDMVKGAFVAAPSVGNFDEKTSAVAVNQVYVLPRRDDDSERPLFRSVFGSWRAAYPRWLADAPTRPLARRGRHSAQSSYTRSHDSRERFSEGSVYGMSRPVDEDETPAVGYLRSSYIEHSKASCDSPEASSPSCGGRVRRRHRRSSSEGEKKNRYGGGFNQGRFH